MGDQKNDPDSRHISDTQDHPVGHIVHMTT